jgi:hypothetical protein
MDQSSFIPLITTAVYFLPSIIAFSRKARNPVSILVVNFFLGWTIIGWIIALAMSVRTNDRSSSKKPEIQSQKQLPPPTGALTENEALLMNGARRMGASFGAVRNVFTKGKSNFSVENTKKPFYKKWWVLVILGLIIFYLVAPKKQDSDKSNSNSTEQSASPDTTPSTPWSENIVASSNGAELSKSACAAIGSFIDLQAKVISDRLNATEVPSLDNFESADFLKTIEWEDFEHKQDIVRQELAITDPILVQNSVLAPTDLQKKDFLQESFATCALGEVANDLIDDAIKLDLRLQSMKVKANNLPWYPDGFSEYEKGIAFRWLNSSEYNCSYGDHCWGMLIVAKNGCPSSLYAEITILDSNKANIGFTNDTTSRLSPNQQARLVFEDFTPGAKSAQLSKISCY